MRSALACLAMMDLLKVQVLNSLVFLAFGLPLPFLPASLAFIAAFLLARRSRGIGKGGWTRHLPDAIGLTLTILGIYLPLAPATASAPALALLALASGLSYWGRGAWLGRQEASHPRFLARFDEGIAVFAAALGLVALGGERDPLPSLLTLPFFLFGLLALGLSNAAASKKAAAGPDGFPRSRAWPVPAAIFAALALASLAISLIVPRLLDPVAGAARELGQGSLAFVDALGRFLDRLFVFTPASPRSPGIKDPKLLRAGGSEPQGLPLVDLVFLVILATLALLAALFLVRVAYLAVRGSAAGGKGGGRRGLDYGLLPALLRRALRFLGRHAGIFLTMLKARMPRRREARSGALKAYARLQASGRLGGLARSRVETPREYGRRLVLAFPRFAAAIDLVVEGLELEVYGGRTLDGATELKLSEARRMLRASGFIVERIRIALRGPSRRYRFSASP